MVGTKPGEGWPFELPSSSRPLLEGLGLSRFTTRYPIKATKSKWGLCQPSESAAGSSPWGSRLDAYFDVAAGWTSLPCGKRRRSLSGTGWPCARHTCDVTTDKRAEIGIAQRLRPLGMGARRALSKLRSDQSKGKLAVVYLRSCAKYPSNR